MRGNGAGPLPVNLDGRATRRQAAASVGRGERPRPVLAATPSALIAPLAPLPELGLLAVGRARVVELVDVVSAKVVTVLSGSDGVVQALAPLRLPGGETALAGGGSDGTIRLWDPVTGRAVADPLAAHDDGESPVALPSEGLPEVFASRGGVWSLATVPLPDGRTALASGARSGELRLWDPAGWRAIGEPIATHAGPVRGLAAVPGLRHLLASAGEYGLHLWDPVTGSRVGTSLGLGAAAVCPVQVPDGRVLLAAAYTGRHRPVRLWDPVAGRLVRELPSQYGWCESLAAVPLPDGRTALAGAYRSGQVSVWDPATGESIGFVESPGGRDRVAMVLLPGGRGALATVDRSGTPRLWDPGTGRPLTGGAATRPSRVVGVDYVAAVERPGGRRLLVTGSGHATWWWDPVTAAAAPTPPPADGDERGAPGGPGEPWPGPWRGAVAHASVRVPGRDDLVAVCDQLGQLRLRDRVDGKQVGRWLTRSLAKGIDPSSRYVPTLAAVQPPDGPPLLVAGDGEGAVRLWDAVTWQPVGEQLRGHRGGVLALEPVPLPGGRWLLAAGALDGTVRLWDPVTGSQVGGALAAHRGGVRWLVAVPLPGRRTLLVTAGARGRARLWAIDLQDSSRTAPVLRPRTRRLGRRHDAQGEVAVVTVPDVVVTPVATLVASEAGWATLLPDGRSYKCGGDAGDLLWWEVRGCRLETEQLERYRRRPVRRLPDADPIL